MLKFVKNGKQVMEMNDKGELTVHDGELKEQMEKAMTLKEEKEKDEEQ